MHPNAAHRTVRSSAPCSWWSSCWCRTRCAGPCRCRCRRSTCEWQRAVRSAMAVHAGAGGARQLCPSPLRARRAGARMRCRPSSPCADAARLAGGARGVPPKAGRAPARPLVGRRVVAGLRQQVRGRRLRAVIARLSQPCSWCCSPCNVVLICQAAEGCRHQPDGRGNQPQSRPDCGAPQPKRLQPAASLVAAPMPKPMPRTITNLAARAEQLGHAAGASRDAAGAVRDAAARQLRRGGRGVRQHKRERERERRGQRRRSSAGGCWRHPSC